MRSYREQHVAFTLVFEFYFLEDSLLPFDDIIILWHCHLLVIAVILLCCPLVSTLRESSGEPLSGQLLLPLPCRF